MTINDKRVGATLFFVNKIKVCRIAGTFQIWRLLKKRAEYDR